MCIHFNYCYKYFHSWEKQLKILVLNTSAPTRSPKLGKSFVRKATKQPVCNIRPHWTILDLFNSFGPFLTSLESFWTMLYHYWTRLFEPYFSYFSYFFYFSYFCYFSYFPIFPFWILSSYWFFKTRRSVFDKDSFDLKMLAIPKYLIQKYLINPLQSIPIVYQYTDIMKTQVLQEVSRV